MQHPPKKQIKKTGKKTVIWLMGLALAGAAVLVLLLPVIRAKFPVQTLEYEIRQSTVRSIGTREKEQIATITIDPDGQNGYTLRMQSGVLMLESGGVSTPIDEAYQKTILDTLTMVSVQNTVTENAAEAEAEWEAMGLTNPQAKAVVCYLDGSTETMEVGAMAPGTAEYYFRWSGAPGIYLCHSGVLENLTLASNALLSFEPVSLLSPLVQSLKIQNANGECEVAFAGGSSGNLTLPCVYPIADETAQTLLAALSNFRLGSYVAALNEENSAFYGFDAPLCTLQINQRAGATNAIDDTGSLTVVQNEAKQYQFVIGRAEGEFFYTCAYEGDIYLVSRFLLETLVQADWTKLISRTPAAMGTSQLTDIVFETPQKTVEVNVARTESVLENNQLEVDQDGNLVYRTEATVNGKTVPQEKLDILLDSLSTFAVEGAIPAGAKTESEPRWRMTLVTEEGDIRILEGYRLDVFSDAVAVNGVMCHYVYDGAIDVLMAGLE